MTQPMVKKVMKVVMGFLAAWVLIAIVDEAWDQWSRSDYAPANRPKKLTEFQSVSLGMSMDEVAYALAYPENVYRIEQVDWGDGSIKDVRVKISEKELQKAKNGVKDYPVWSYVMDRSGVTITFDAKQKRVASISCSADKDPYRDCYANRIYIGMGEASVIEKLGTPTHSSIDDTLKTLQYDQWNMTVRLMKRSVVNIEVHE